MSAATIIPPRSDEPLAGGSFTAEHRRELALARERAKAIHRAARVAAFNGWATAAVAALSAPFALFSVVGFLMTVALSAVACNELRGRKRLLEFDPSAATLLGWNQLGLLTMIVVYCLWMIATSLAGTSALAAELNGYAELEAVLGSTSEFTALYQQLVIVLYGSVIALSAVFQGLNALYYFTRRKHVAAYVAETPEWIRDLQRM